MIDYGYAARSERMTNTLRNQPVAAVSIASAARQPAEDGYPASGDMIATMHRGSERRRIRRRKRFERLERKSGAAS